MIKQIEILPNGCSLYIDTDPHPAGGRVYYSDECGIVAQVWDTCICSEDTLLAAVLAEKRFQRIDSMNVSMKKQNEIAKQRKTLVDINNDEGSNEV